MCGCAIISPNTLITAAHCVFGLLATDLDVLVGTNDLSNGGKMLRVKNYKIHENYTDT